MSTDAIARDLLDRLQTAWNAGDGPGYAAPYTDGASHLTVRGDDIHGRDEIGAGHAEIVATVYADSTLRIELIESRPVGDDVVVATTRNTLDVPRGPLAGVRQAVGTVVLVRQDTDWRVEASHNTLVAV